MDRPHAACLLLQFSSVVAWYQQDSAVVVLPMVPSSFRQDTIVNCGAELTHERYGWLHYVALVGFETNLETPT